MNHKRKIELIIVVTLLVVVAIAVVLCLNFLQRDRDPYGLAQSGTYYEHLSDFSIEVGEEPPDALTKAYLESITYEILDIDSAKMTAAIEVTIPDFSDQLSNTLDQVIAQNKEEDYDVLKAKATSALIDLIKAKEYKTETTRIDLDLKQTDGTFQLVPNAQWNQLISGNLEKLYIEYLKTWIGGMTNETP